MWPRVMHEATHREEAPLQASATAPERFELLVTDAAATSVAPPPVGFLQVAQATDGKVQRKGVEHITF